MALALTRQHIDGDALIVCDHDPHRLETVRRLQAEAQSRDAQLKMLKYQLNPHFLFNALNSITALVRIGDKGAAEETVSRLAEFLRVILDHNDELDHTLEEEIGNLELYLGIEKVRFEDRLRVRMDLTPRAKSALVPSLVLQPLFENAIKHAVGKSLAPTTVSLSARTFAGPTGDERLELIVADTGPNRSSAELELAPKGIGLTNTKQRLESYFGGKYSFAILPNEPQGLSIRIEIPFLPGHAFSQTTPLAGKTSGHGAPRCRRMRLQPMIPTPPCEAGSVERQQRRASWRETICAETSARNIGEQGFAMTQLEYKGYVGTAELSEDDDVFHGKLAFLSGDLVTYESDTAGGLVRAFHDSFAGETPTVQRQPICGDISSRRRA